MTNFEWLKSLDENEMCDFLQDITSDIFTEEFNKKFCDKCSDIELTDDVGNTHSFAYCEIEGNVCPHFNGNCVKWWLQAEHDSQELLNKYIAQCIDYFECEI